MVVETTRLPGAGGAETRTRFYLPIRLTLALLLGTAPLARAASRLPANLLISSKADPHHVILVEKASQRLFVYEFNGRYRLLHSFPCATGENAGDKKAKGDRKTPEGIYFFTKSVDGRYLTPIYGARAFPLNYPNLIDRRRRKDGNGIWLHGAKEPPKERSTNGCIAMRNQDIVQLDPYIRPWGTAIIIEERLKYEDPARLECQGRCFLKRIEAWRRAWSGKQLDRYLSYYAVAFRWKNLDLQGWRRRKQRLNRLYRAISVQLSDIRLFRQADLVLASFEQLYRSDRFATHGYKRLYLVRSSNQWRILGEEWQKSGRPAPPRLRLAGQKSTAPEISKAGVNLFLDKWRQAWQRGDLSGYISCYHPGFTSAGMDRWRWRLHKQRLFRRSKRREIRLSRIRVHLQGRRRAAVDCIQSYRAANHQDYGLKTLHLRLYQGKWTIWREGWQPLPAGG